MNKQKLLDDIEQSIKQNKVCNKLAKTANNLVFGDGNPDAEIVFVGEAPGKNEDLQGKPFVGVAGKFLDEMLSSINMKREKVYITNIVKYRPPNNRDPLPEEKKEFLPYLRSQIEVINPKIIATLGRHSMNCFLPDLQIGQIHGQPKRIKISSIATTEGKDYSVIIMPLFHPAAALYNGSMRQTLIEDFALLPNVLKKITKDN